MKLSYIFLTIVFILLNTSTVFAVENPLTLPNNKFGVHILFDTEITDAAAFVNSNGGDWGYVTIPLQNGDRDLTKWQAFMDKARELHIIPIIRLASEGDYFNTKVWKKPTFEDIVDFANFIDSLQWPVKNRYVIIFNEVNRADEWGGEVNPEEYAELLQFATTVFKSKSQDYFIISAGLDNAAPEEFPEYMNEYNYLRRMQEAVPGVFNQIDAFASHSYPNPGFSQPPYVDTTKSISSFSYERQLIRQYRNSDIPVFITETGWNASTLSNDTKAEYYKQAFETAWSDPGIIAVTPFLLYAGSGPFEGFTFLNADRTPTKQYTAVQELQKLKGAPTQTAYVLGAEGETDQELPIRTFPKSPKPEFSLSDTAQEVFHWILKL